MTFSACSPGTANSLISRHGSLIPFHGSPGPATLFSEMSGPPSRRIRIARQFSVCALSIVSYYICSPASFDTRHNVLPTQERLPASFCGFGLSGEVVSLKQKVCSGSWAGVRSPSVSPSLNWCFWPNSILLSEGATYLKVNTTISY